MTVQEEHVTFNGSWYRVTAPNGQTWTFDESDLDLAYIESSLFAWSRIYDFVKEREGE